MADRTPRTPLLARARVSRSVTPRTPSRRVARPSLPDLLSTPPHGQPIEMPHPMQLRLAGNIEAARALEERIQQVRREAREAEARRREEEDGALMREAREIIATLAARERHRQQERQRNDLDARIRLIKQRAIDEIERQYNDVLADQDIIFQRALADANESLSHMLERYPQALQEGVRRRHELAVQMARSRLPQIIRSVADREIANAIAMAPSIALESIGRGESEDTARYEGVGNLRVLVSAEIRRRIFNVDLTAPIAETEARSRRYSLHRAEDRRAEALRHAAIELRRQHDEAQNIRSLASGGVIPRASPFQERVRAGPRLNSPPRAPVRRSRQEVSDDGGDDRLRHRPRRLNFNDF